MPDPIDRLSAALADRYRIERELGAGGMATVYLAHDVKHDRKVALKVLRPELAAVIGAERFLTEIKTTANLQHPNILPLHDSGEVVGTVFYVMPFVEGESLRDRLEREKQLPIADAVRIASEVSGALDYAHRHGIIHRDIKPENILLHDGRALVADFGIALAVSRSEGSSRLTETGMSLGTPHYMSPEQALGERDLDARADVYAIGCVLYEMLTGEPPFDGPTAQAIIAKVMASEPVPVQELRRTVPPHVAAATGIALQKLPADRFATAAELGKALQDQTGTLAQLPSAARGHPAGRVVRAAPWAVAAVAVVSAAWIALHHRAASAGSPVRFTIPAPVDDGMQANVAIDPSGTFLVYSATHAGLTRLYRRDLADPEPHALPGTEGATWPTVSPDGRSIAFAGADQGVYRLDLDGGGPRKLVSLNHLPLGLAWSAHDGLVLGMLAFSSVNGLSLVTPGTDSLRMITHPDTSVGHYSMHHFPYVPPGTDVALFDNTSDRHLGIASLDDGTFTTLDLRIGDIVGVVQGVLLYLDGEGALTAVRLDVAKRRLVGRPLRVPGAPTGIEAGAVAENGTLALRIRPQTFQLAELDEHGVGETLLPDTVERVIARFAPDGNRIALLGRFHGTVGVWIYDMRSRALSRLPLHRGRLWAMSWAPNGRDLVIAVNHDHAVEVRIAPADASAPDTLLCPLPDNIVPGDVSLMPTGKTLLIESVFGKGGANVYTFTPARDTALVPFAAGPANEGAPDASPDGRWVAYSSDESGGSQVYIRPFPGPGARIQVSDSGGSAPAWSAGGHRMFYVSGRSLMAADLAHDPASGTLRVTGRHRLFTGDFLHEGSFARMYDVAPDSRHFLVARAVGEARSQVVVWTDWLGALKKQLANE